MKLVSMDNINSAKQIYGKLIRWGLANKILTDFFNNNPLNKSEDIVTAKICLVDGLYKTNLKDQIGLTQHILKIGNLDALLKEGNIGAVNKISKFGKINIISFASKYCHFHNKDAYSIYDKYVCISLKELMDWRDNRNYGDFLEAVISFRKSNNLNASFEDLDKYLWLFGFYDRLSKGKTDINREIRELHTQQKELFAELMPV